MSRKQTKADKVARWNAMKPKPPKAMSKYKRGINYGNRVRGGTALALAVALTDTPPVVTDKHLLKEKFEP